MPTFCRAVCKRREPAGFFWEFHRLLLMSQEARVQTSRGPWEVGLPLRERAGAAICHPPFPVGRKTLLKKLRRGSGSI